MKKFNLKGVIILHKAINLNEYAGHIINSLSHGILLTTKANDKVNTMAIGWGTLGINWTRPIFAVYVREGRYTRSLLDSNPEFTINIPVKINKDSQKIIGFCGTRSGRDLDKIQLAGLTLTDSEKISVPGIQQLPLTLECRVLYRQIQDLPLLNDEKLRDSLYPQNIASSATGANRDVHVSYYGEILANYIIE